jgi:hypothetical protein
VRLLDEASLLACAAYVDLNPIRAALAETLEQSDFTSVQRRIQTLPQTPPGVPEAGSEAEDPGPDRRSRGAGGPPRAPAADRFLAPLTIDERATAPRVSGNGGGSRCSDKGFLPLSVPEYLELLDWTARQTVAGKRGRRRPTRRRSWSGCR